jgi:diguanylate cyclase (GGDEF)-like protein
MGAGTARDTGRLFVVHALITLVPVVMLGAVLGASFRRDADRRGIEEGKREAALVAETAIEPLLAGHPLDNGLSAPERAAIVRLVRSVDSGSVLRLRLRGLDGRVVFADDNSGFSNVADDESIDAGRGEVHAAKTRLNADANDEGPTGTQAIEVYTQLRAGPEHRPVGALEIYLPYASIQADINARLYGLYRMLAIALAALYFVLFVIASSVSKGLRRHARLNAFLAEHDTLTGLPNRELFHRRVEAALADSQKTGKYAAVAIVDLDRFKEVNDTLGHHNGDLLLTELASRLEATMRDGDTVARLGGDEFGVVLRNVRDPQAVLVELRNVIDREVEISGLPLSVEASIGYVVAPYDGADADELMQRADVAMYVAKTNHAGVVRYDTAHDHYDSSNLALVAELRHAIDDDQLVLHYQPKVTTADGRVEAVETLVRWQHPVHGLLYPDAFLPLAEQTDLIDKLTDWVLRHALTEVALLGPVAADLPVAVNVSARNLARSDFAQTVVNVLDEQGVPPQRLIIEITETALLVDPARATKVLGELALAGVRVSLDDFGCGQTSLGYLSALPVHELKIDKSFVWDMLENPAHAAIVRSIVDLGHNLSLRVVGEGVETDEVLHILRDTGCDVAQGYFFARPMPAPNLREWLAHAATQAAATDVAKPAPGVSAAREFDAV